MSPPKDDRGDTAIAAPPAFFKPGADPVGPLSGALPTKGVLDDRLGGGKGVALGLGKIVGFAGGGTAIVGILGRGGTTTGGSATGGFGSGRDTTGSLGGSGAGAATRKADC
jgi:hypothetical protein